MWFKKLFKSKKNFILSITIISLAIGLISATVIIGLRASGAFLKKRVIVAEPLSNEQGSKRLADIQHAYRQVAQKTLPAVVEIGTFGKIKQKRSQFKPKHDVLSVQQEDQQQSRNGELRQFEYGSGLMVNREGRNVYVLTNMHVIGEADEISIRLYDERYYKATLVGKDPKRDLALVVFESSEDVPVAELGSSNEVQVGDIVFAVGNPLELGSSITTGIVSAVGRKPIPGSERADFTDYIQTDTVINPRNSGGPLVNKYGQVIGINTYVPSPSAKSVGPGFTIPINIAKKVIEDFIIKGKVENGWLGVSFTDLPKQMYKSLGVEGLTGSFVYNVYKDSPADKAGILPGDYITSVNSEQIENATHFLFIVANLIPNRIYDFQLTRAGVKKRLSVKIAEKIGEDNLEWQTKNLWPGMFIINITEDIQKQLNLPKRAGNLIIAQVDQDTPAATSGFRPGDLIQTANGKKVSNLLDFYTTFNSRSSKTIVFGIYRQEHELKIRLER